MLENRLHALYYDLKNPTAYASTHQLQTAVEDEDPEKVQTWLERQKTYTLHKPVRYRFPRRMYNVYNVADCWEADLADFRKLKNYNDGYNYVLVCIDILSKYVFAEPLYDKTAQSVADAFERIFRRCGDRMPLTLQSDKGTEFTGAATQKVLKKYNVVFRKTQNDVKASCIERYIRSLKGRMWRYFTHHHTNRYIDVLDKIVDAYNSSVHSAIKMTPASVTRYNASQARQNLIKRYSVRRKMRCKYKVGDLVRISKEKKVFGKGYENGYTVEIFRIARVSTTRNPVVYYLEDLKKEAIDCFFYEEELTRVQKNLLDDEFEIAEILDSRGKGKNKQVLVRWAGYADKFNSWIKASSVKDL